MSVLCSGARCYYSAFLPPVNVVHEEESASGFHHVHGGVNILDPGREAEVSE